MMRFSYADFKFMRLFRKDDDAVMRISFPNGIYPSYSGAPNNRGIISSEQQPSPEAKAASDSVQISAASAFRAQLAQACKKSAGEIQGAVSAKRLNSLREQFAAGTYQASSAQVADKIVQRAFASGERFGNE